VSASARSRGTIAVINSQATSLRLILEPWGDQMSISPGQTVRLLLSGPEGGHLEVELKGNDVILYGGEGSVISTVETTDE